MFITPVSENEIITTVKSYKPKHSKDCDDMSMYVVSKVIWPIEEEEEEEEMFI